MNVEYSNRATSDLHKIAADSRTFGAAVTEAVEVRIRNAIAYIAEHPEASPEVHGRPGMRMAPLVRYPCLIFYRVFDDRIRIVHIRHTSRRPWQGVR
jgi:plasmid stabilization system protein ParE